MLLIPFIFSTFLAFADSCQCPVVQCDPCQKILRLGTEELSCGYFGKMECDKVVCENVDNYFQCLAGEPELYLAPQNLTSRITEPQDPADKKPRAIDFQKLSEQIDTQIIDNEVSMEPKEISVKKQEIKPSRQLASSVAVQEKSLSEESLVFSLSLVQGQVEANHKKLKKKLQTSGTFRLKASQKSSVVIASGKGDFRIKLSAGTEVFVKWQEGLLWVDVETGDAIVELAKMNAFIAVDFGFWRFAKQKGILGLSRQSDMVTLLNESDVGYLRRNELIAEVQKIEPKKVLQISLKEGLVASRDERQTEVKKEYQLSSPFIPTAQARSPAGDHLCRAPEAAFESCAWKCFGSKSNDKKCVGEKNTQCVRFTCSADGQWKLPTFVGSTECSVGVVRVGNCQ